MMAGMNETLRIAVIAIVAVALAKAVSGKVPALAPLGSHL